MDENKNQPNSFIKYSGLGLQMLVTLGIGAWLGLKLDQYLKLKYPVFLVTFIFVLFAGLMVMLYRNLNKE
jgi:hypothetical protein